VRGGKIIGLMAFVAVALSVFAVLPTEGLTEPTKLTVKSASFEGIPQANYSDILVKSVNAAAKLFMRLNIAKNSTVWQKLREVNASAEVIRDYEGSGNYTAAYLMFKKALYELNQLVRGVIKEYVQRLAKGLGIGLRKNLTRILAEARALNITADHLLIAIRRAEDRGLMNSTQADELISEVENQVKILSQVTNNVSAALSSRVSATVNVNMTLYKEELREVIHNLSKIRIEVNMVAGHHIGVRISSIIKSLISKLQGRVKELRGEAKRLRLGGNSLLGLYVLKLSNNVTKMISSIKANITLAGNMTELMRALRRMEAYVFALKGLNLRLRAESEVIPRVYNSTKELGVLRNESSQLKELVKELGTLVNECVSQVNKTSAQINPRGKGGGVKNSCKDCSLIMNLTAGIERSVMEITNLAGQGMSPSLRGRARHLEVLRGLMGKEGGQLYSDIFRLRTLILRDCGVVNPNLTNTIIMDLQTLSFKLHRFEVDLKRSEAVINQTLLSVMRRRSEGALGLINASLRILSSVRRQLTINNCTSKAIGYVNESINYLTNAEAYLRNNKTSQSLQYVEGCINSLESALHIVGKNCTGIRSLGIEARLEVSIQLLEMVKVTIS